MKRPVQLAHVVFRTSNYEKMIAWYKKLLNATVTFGNEMVSFITFDQEHHRIAFINIPDLNPAVSGVCGVDHVAFTYDSLRHMLDNYSKLKMEGINPFWCINHGPTTSMYYRDPDNNQVELQVENFKTIEESTEFFYSEEFKENPIGVEFDPEFIKKKLEEGVPESHLKKRPASGPRGLNDGVPLK